MFLHIHLKIAGYITHDAKWRGYWQHEKICVLQYNFNKNISSVLGPSGNISSVLCGAVSGMPPTQWRGVRIHQHTGKWEWGLNNRVLSHCYLAKYVGKHCLQSAPLLSGTEKENKKKGGKLIMVHSTSEETPLGSSHFYLKKKIQQHEAFRFREQLPVL